MAACPYCHKSVGWWRPLTAWRGEILFCRHCMRPVRVDRRRYALLTGTSTAAIAAVNLLPSDNHYVLLAITVAAALLACVLLGKVVKADSEDDA